jgi:SPP1 family predicted phage head-tail adaptor
MSSIRAGQLSRRIRIQIRSTGQDSFGAPQQGWIDLATVWADIQPLTGRELESAQRIASEVSHRIAVRSQAIFADTRVVAGYRALYSTPNGTPYGPRIFNLHACLIDEQGDATVTLLASEGVNDG